jgi:hypothetical protein
MRQAWACMSGMVPDTSRNAQTHARVVDYDSTNREADGEGVYTDWPLGNIARSNASDAEELDGVACGEEATVVEECELAVAAFPRRTPRNASKECRRFPIALRISNRFASAADSGLNGNSEGINSPLSDRNSK